MIYAMNVEITVPEVVGIFKKISIAPEKLFEMMRLDIQKVAADYLNALMDGELMVHLGRKQYERCKITVNHRNGSYPINLLLKELWRCGSQYSQRSGWHFQERHYPKRATK